MTLRALTEDAAYAVEQFRRPNIAAFVQKIDKVLMAGKKGAIGNDRVDAIHLGKDAVTISTSYSIRNCEQTGEYVIPNSVIDAEDPIAEIKIFAKKEREREALDRVVDARRALDHAEELLRQAQKEEF